ncbi:MAG: hypothetical protein OXI15_05870, partial [Chromatiales bacterium]|nr:hypothetical protein [Chromatiales bacterium]
QSPSNNPQTAPSDNVRALNEIVEQFVEALHGLPLRFVSSSRNGNRGASGEDGICGTTVERLLIWMH